MVRTDGDPVWFPRCDKFGQERLGDRNPWKNKGKFTDKKTIQWFNCDKFSHFVNECWLDKGKQKESEEQKACLAQEDDSNSDPVLLMATVTEEPHRCEKLFLDTWCSNHIIG